MDNQPNQISKQDRSRTKWTLSLDKIFVDLALEQVLQGHWSNNVFSKMAWKHIHDEFNKQTGLEFNRKQLKKHLDVLRNRYYNVKSQFDQSSFGVDESRQVLMSGDEVWEDYIEVYPLDETTRSKDYPIHEQLCKICSESGGIGKYAQSSHYVELGKEIGGMGTPWPLRCSKAASVSVDLVNPSTFVEDGSSPPKGVDVNLDAQNKRKPVTLSSSRCCKRKCNEFDGAIAEAMLDMVIASKVRANAMIPSGDKLSMTKCVEVLDKMGDLDERLYFASLDLLEKPNLRETFISLKSGKRLTWLQGECNTSFG